MASSPARNTYRHGNLRAEAITAAYDLALAGGLAALTLRAVAEKVGVAHRSLYNHFADREALIDAVAQCGYEGLARLLTQAATPAAFVRIYVGFALSNPNLYTVMASRPHHTMRAKTALHQAAQLSVAEALRIFGAPHRTMEENRRAVMKVLILLHGGIVWHAAGILDVAGDEGLISELQAMAASG